MLDLFLESGNALQTPEQVEPELAADLASAAIVRFCLTVRRSKS